MNCSSCKTDNPVNAKFCCECGKRFYIEEKKDDFFDKEFCTLHGENLDITRGKLLEVEHCKRILDYTLDAIIITEELGRIVYWNKGAEKIFEYTEGEVLGNNLYQVLVPEELHEAYKEVFIEFSKTMNTYLLGKTVERPLKKKDGTLIIAEISFSKIEVQDNIYIVGVVRDASIRKQLEEKLEKERLSLEKAVEIRTRELNESLIKLQKANEILLEQKEKEQEYTEQLQVIYDGIIDGLAIIDIETRNIISVNPSFCKMTGYSEEELRSMKMDDVHPPEQKKKLSKDFPEIIKRKGEYVSNIPMQRKDGSIFFADIGDNTIIYNNKNCLLGFFRDTTDRKKTERIKENFIATLSHDLRVPLLAENQTLKYLIKGSYGKLTDKQDLAAQQMLNSNKDLLNMVNTLLDVYRYESRSFDIIKDDVNLFKIVSDAITELSPLIECHKKNIELLIPEDFISVRGDKKEIKRVVINILSNAISYTPDHSLIKIESERKNNFVIIKIKDNGKGISEDELGKIFDLYYTSSKKFRKVGTGLGLYLSKQIINSHGGEIWVESKVDEGSIFYFSLPINDEIV